METLLLIAKMVYFFLPAGVANMAPVVFKNYLQFLAVPVDGGRTFHGTPIFGSHKTWRGILLATLAGGIFYFGQRALFVTLPQTASWIPFDPSFFPWWFGFPFAFGAITGDLVKSFFKRRRNRAPGTTWFPFDQLDFLLGAAFVASFFVNFSIGMWLIIFLIGPLFHIAVNHFGFWLKLKETAW